MTASQESTASCANQETLVYVIRADRISAIVFCGHGTEVRLFYRGFPSSAEFNYVFIRIFLVLEAALKSVAQTELAYD